MSDYYQCQLRHLSLEFLFIFCLCLCCWACFFIISLTVLSLSVTVLSLKHSTVASEVKEALKSYSTISISHPFPRGTNTCYYSKGVCVEFGSDSNLLLQYFLLYRPILLRATAYSRAILSTLVSTSPSKMPY